MEADLADINEAEITGAAIANPLNIIYLGIQSLRSMHVGNKVLISKYRAMEGTMCGLSEFIYVTHIT